MFQDVLPEDLREMRASRGLVLVDVRSPSEFEEATIPGSLNIPLFDDAERAEIGTIYKQESPDAAKQRGLEIVSAKLPAFIRSFADLPGKKAVFCWRGGMRSKTTATVLSLMGIHAYRIAGGYRAYRRWVVETLETYEIRVPVYVLHGNTGTGKTSILRALKQQGYPVLDLEGLAAHRGSIFGQIGLRGHNQKTFDSLLLEELIRYEGASYLIIEAESRRIGKVVLPDFLIRKKEEGPHIWLEIPMGERVRYILEDYRPWKHREACMAAFSHIKSRIHTPIAREIEDCLKTERYEIAVEMLLKHYYDPRYAYSSEGYESEPGTVLRAQTVEEAVQNMKRLLPDPKR
ncbi:tRNA 2-selenouridine(34) synthase MnmH [Cohnella sp. CFH 77786]|uniref:tRNA 2-selenouridine(34) synthase MnmH n=1 Tax=Cohnella sp. CFH 77786 TaxID=2662265 RepID=UPI001C609648|nr:tRNA 2-selenouridine(34) synthase MnmH [Cohnella sp. CFH 77786]MBW5446323.1 tRNA 2-selenouridine(34) synthase MnmH [Cohnella sp. CFH 77786]